MNQKEAVFKAVVAVTGFSGEGVCEPTREQRASIQAILVEGFKSGGIELRKSFSDSELKVYVSGLVSNWLRKDKRLNGNIDYEPKNPGSRAGSGDAQLKALRALMSTLTDPTDRAEVQKHIDARVTEIEMSRMPEIDYSKLPAELAKFKKN